MPRQIRVSFLVRAALVVFCLFGSSEARKQQGSVSFTTTEGSEFSFAPVELDFADQQNFSVHFSLASVVEQLFNSNSPIVHHTYKKMRMFDGLDPSQLAERLERETKFKSYRVGVRDGKEFEEVNGGALQPSFLRETLFAKNIRAEAIHPLLFCFEAVQRLVLPKGLLASVVDAVENRRPETYTSKLVKEGVWSRSYGMNIPNDKPERYVTERIKHTEWQHTASINTDRSCVHMKNIHTPVKTVVAHTTVVGNDIGAKQLGQEPDKLRSLSFYSNTPDFSPHPGQDKIDRNGLIVQWVAGDH